MSTEIEGLVSRLREYAATEHGKRSRLHTDIMQMVFADPAKLADALSQTIPRTTDEGMREILARYDAAVAGAQPCRDGNCVIRKPSGQHTNGGCRCWKDPMKAQRMMIAGRELAAAMRRVSKTDEVDYIVKRLENIIHNARLDPSLFSNGTEVADALERVIKSDGAILRGLPKTDEGRK